ncbi:chaperone protein ClpB3, mitochondrial-like [Macadamia integrifolia]|uniref:chaperone protein ClpB3, mitochondrial-like n=1 Tax=Macadamia integrifolia TaxID=60698 RepID=UPI001C500B3A|nr:chaperone protein ClpB3, mitochondrial-like [Macadamia integrifolia]
MAGRAPRLVRSAYAAMNARNSGCSAPHHSRLFVPLSAELSGVTIASNGISSVAYSPTGVTDGVAKSVNSLNGVEKGPLRLFHSSTPSYHASVSSSQVNQSEYTEMAWEGIVGAVDAARLSKQQVVETEHLMKALLEQKDGLARRIFTKAGIDNSSVLQATDDFIRQQPKVVGDTSGPIMGSHLQSLLDNARKHKKELGDDFLSVEHLLLAFLNDKRFGQQLLKNLQLGEKELKDAVQAVRGNQRVTDQSINHPFNMFDS